MGIINNLKVYMDERKKDKEERKKYKLAYELESKKLRNYKEEIRNITLAELEFEESESEYEKEKIRLINDTDVKYYIIDDNRLDSLLILGKNEKYVEYEELLYIRPKEELDKLIANKDYKGLIKAVNRTVYFAQLIEIERKLAESMIEEIEECNRAYKAYEDVIDEGLFYIFGPQISEVEEIIDTILEEKYFAEHPESAQILMKKRK